MQSAFLLVFFAALPVVAQTPLGAGRFEEHELTITATPFGGCQPVSTPPRITGLKIPTASASLPIAQVFAVNCSLTGAAQMEITLAPQFPANPGSGSLGPAPGAGPPEITLAAAAATTLTARFKARTERFNRLSMVSAHGSDGVILYRGCRSEQSGRFDLPAGTEASGDISSQCRHTILPAAQLVTIDGKRYWRSTLTSYVSGVITSALTVVVVVRSSYLYDVDAGAPAGENISVGEDIRVAQAVQMAGNKVPLVPLKRTVLRAPVSYAGTRTFASFTGRVNAYRDGVRHSLSPVSPDSSMVVARGASGDVDADDPAVLHVSLPIQWTLPGKWEYEVELVPDDGFADSNAADNRRRVTVEYEHPVNWPRSFTIGVIPVSRLTFEPFEGTPLYTPPNLDLLGQLGRKLAQLLPVPDGYTIVTMMSHHPVEPKRYFPPNSQGLHAFVNQMRRSYRRINAIAPGQFDQLMFATGSGMFPAASSDPAFSDGRGGGRIIVLPAFDFLDAGRLDLVTAHEIAHNLGQRHTATGARCPGYDASTTDTSHDSETSWPRPNDPSIGVAGWDHDSHTLVARGTGDLMSYCPEKWLSPYSSEYLFRSNALKPEQNTGKPPRIQSWPPRGAAGEELLLSGWVSAGGDEGGLDPGYVLPAAGEQPAGREGNTCLVLEGESGELARSCFELNFATLESRETLERAHFTYPVPVPAGLSRVRLTHAGSTLATLSPGAAPPEIRIVEPTAGAVWDGGIRWFRWEGSDADSDKLTYSVMYSADGQTWTPIEDDIEQSEAKVDSGRIPGGSAARWRVYATDGIHTSYAEAGPFEVRQQPRLEVAGAFDLGAGLPGRRITGALELRNSGTGVIRVREIRTTDSRFSFGQPAYPISIGPAGALALQLSFVSARETEAAAILSLVLEDGAEHRVSLRARTITSGNPAIAVSPAALELRASAATGAVRVSNTGLTNLTITGVTSTSPLFRVDGPRAFTLIPGGAREILVTFVPSGGDAAGTLRIASSDPALPVSEVNLRGTASTAAAVPAIEADPPSLAFGAVQVGASAERRMTLRNSGAAPLTILALEATPGVFQIVTPPPVPFTIAPGGERALSVRASPLATALVDGQLTVRSDDPLQPALRIPLSVSGETAAPARELIFSDSFDRSSSDPCSLGGVSGYYYLPLFGGGSPVGAAVNGSALTHRNQDYGGVQVQRSPTPCVSPQAADFGQDIQIAVDLLVPRTGNNVTQAGPFFRARAAFRGDGIIGGQNAGYWVQLSSTGQVTVKNLNTAVIAASSQAIAGFDAGVSHRLEITARGTALQVSVDGAAVLNATLAPTAGSNNGAIGIAFGAEPNRGAAGGQRADNLAVYRVQ